MTRSDYLRLLSRKLGRRRVVYFGTRGADARSLTDLMNFECIFSQIAPSGLAGVEEVCLERMTRKRVDLDTYSIDQDRADAVAEMRVRMLTAFENAAAVIPYRSCALLASAWFPRSERVLHLGNFHDLQTSFEHKPWVETQLAAAGVRTIPWKYFADNERPLIEEMLESRPLVVRSNRSDGGTGVRFVTTPQELSTDWPEHADGFLAVAPFIEGLPLNANGVAFEDGQVSRHGVSVQMIGVPGCTTRRFGYCGNDFAAASGLGGEALREIDAMLETVGAWLARHGYRGAFGIDAILSEDGVYLVELNPRFQGSSRMSAALDGASERADMFLAHLGAFLGLPPPDRQASDDLVARPLGAHLIVHAREALVAGGAPGEGATSGAEADLVADAGVTVEPGAMVVDLVFPHAILAKGPSLTAAARSAVEVWSA